MTQPTIPELQELAHGQLDQMVDIRRQLHRHPELSFHEVATTALIDDVAMSLHLKRLRCPTQTGAVWSLQGGKPGKTVLLRADIDALPIDESAVSSYSSETPGTMHACGHDAHVAQLLGAASALSARAEDLPGRYVFLFQPGEEALNGAKDMIAGGVLDDLDASCVIGCHVASALPVGLIGVRSGIAMAEVSGFQIEVGGTGGHGAMATEGSNPLIAAALVATRLGEIVKGLSLEGTDCSCTAGTLHAGTAANIIPSHATITGTLRTFTDSDRDIAVQRIDQLIAESIDLSGCSIRFTTLGSAPAVVNDLEITELVRSVARQVVGGDAVLEMPPVSPSDDVSEFLNRVPGSYFFVSAGRPDGTSGMHHTPEFSIDEACLPIAASVLAGAALQAASPDR